MDLFHNPWMLLSIPAFVAAAFALDLWASRRRESALAAFGRPETLGRLYPAETLGRRKLQTHLGWAGISFLLLALVGPQWGLELIRGSAQGIEAIVAVDTSLSMLTEDAAPNRIGKAKTELIQILNGLEGQRVGVIAFAGEAQIQCPLTSDLEAAKSFVDSLEVGMVPQAGTALAKPLDLAAQMMSTHAGHKAVVLITDGEDHMGQTLEAAKRAAAAGIQVFIIGVGTPEGGPIPLKDAQGHVTAFKKDKNGNTVVSRLGEDGLIQIAKASSGAYFRATTEENEASAILKAISQIEASKIQSGSLPRYKNRFRWPLAIGMLLLAAEMLIPETGALALPTLAALALAFSGCSNEKSAVDLWRGNHDYKGGRFEQALDRYLSASKRNPNDARPEFNAGDARYRMGQWDAAQKHFTDLSDPKKVAPEVASKALFNLGDTFMRQNDCPKAADAFKQCLLLDPKDDDCRFNLVKALECMKNQSKNDQKPQPQKQPQNPPPKPDEKPQQPPHGDRNRPKDMSQEDAERILQAIREREKAAKAHEDENRPKQSAAADNPEADW